MLGQFVASLIAAIPALTDTTHLAVRVDSSRGQIVIEARAIEIPPALAYAGHAGQTALRFSWPVDGWLQGGRAELLDSTGRHLPKEMLHHVAISNLDRRELIDPIAGRIFAAARETAPVSLPSWMGLPVSGGNEMLFYFAVANATDRNVSGARLRVTLGWTPVRAKGPKNMLPLLIDANPSYEHSRTFDVPPGVTTKTNEFTLPVGGRLRALGGHLHDYAKEIRLEDAQSGKVLARLRTKRDANGRVLAIDQTKFLPHLRGIRLEASHRYRAVAVYENPGCAPSSDGAMAFMIGVFLPDDLAKWPAVNKSDPMYLRDIASVSASEHGMDHRGHEDMDAPEPGRACAAKR